MRPTPAIKKAPSAPRHPFQRKPSDAGRAKLTRTAIHCTYRSCQQTSLSFCKSATLSYGSSFCSLKRSQPMFACPHQNRVLESPRAKDENEKPNWPACLESNVREKPVIT